MSCSRGAAARTCHSFTDVLVEHQIAISMDGRGSWRDKVVFLERFWRSVKYEEVYLRAYDSVDEARASLSRYIHFYKRASQHPSGHLEKFLSPSRHESDSVTARGHGRMERAGHGAEGLFRC